MGLGIYEPSCEYRLYGFGHFRAFMWTYLVHSCVWVQQFKYRSSSLLGLHISVLMYGWVHQSSLQNQLFHGLLYGYIMVVMRKEHNVYTRVIMLKEHAACVQ